ncbi:hypothetical protein FKP32DRAFT_212879 [Trametes sanguinea]|nr:hypothetical protein FKP32DRAFT_212879 [Trametes sanguinea]
MCREIASGGTSSRAGWTGASSSDPRGWHGVAMLRRTRGSCCSLRGHEARVVQCSDAITWNPALPTKLTASPIRKPMSASVRAGSPTPLIRTALENRWQQSPRSFVPPPASQLASQPAATGPSLHLRAHNLNDSPGRFPPGRPLASSFCTQLRFSCQALRPVRVPRRPRQSPTYHQPLPARRPLALRAPPGHPAPAKPQDRDLRARHDRPLGARIITISRLPPLPRPKMQSLTLLLPDPARPPRRPTPPSATPSSRRPRASTPP